MEELRKENQTIGCWTMAWLNCQVTNELKEKNKYITGRSIWLEPLQKTCSALRNRKFCHRYNQILLFILITNQFSIIQTIRIQFTDKKIILYYFILSFNHLLFKKMALEPDTPISYSHMRVHSTVLVVGFIFLLFNKQRDKSP
jgi:hypothetical protein